jgi:hypothetical protein
VDPIKSAEERSRTVHVSPACLRYVRRLSEPSAVAHFNCCCALELLLRNNAIVRCALLLRKSIAVAQFNCCCTIQLLLRNSIAVAQFNCSLRAAVAQINCCCAIQLLLRNSIIVAQQFNCSLRAAVAQINCCCAIQLLLRNSIVCCALLLRNSSASLTMYATEPARAATRRRAKPSHRRAHHRGLGCGGWPDHTSMAVARES